MKEKTLRILCIIVISIAFVICMYATLHAFKNYLETGRTYVLFIVVFDTLLVGFNAFNLGYNFSRWRMLDNQKQFAQRFASMIEDKLNSDGYKAQIELEVQEMKSEEEGEKQ